MRTKFVFFLLLSFLSISSSYAVPVGDAFTYQGELSYQGVPASDTFDLKFTLYDADVNGVVVGATLTQAAVQVENGIFNVELDFGTAPFASNQQVWVEIETRLTADAGVYTTLLPRQKITKAPYAGSTAVIGDSSHTDLRKNVAVGEQALISFDKTSTVLTANTAIGYGSLSTSTLSVSNTAVGYNSMQRAEAASNNTAIGYFALADNVSGLRNTAVGLDAMRSATGELEDNTAIGKGALRNAGNDGVSKFNIAIGADAGYFLTSGSGNIYIGANSVGSIENNHIRIGNLTQATYIKGIFASVSPRSFARQVYVDPWGKLVTSKADDFVYSIAAVAIHGSKFVNHVGFGEIYLDGSASPAWATAPVHLPDSASITGMECAVKDTDLTGRVELELKSTRNRTETSLISLGTTDGYVSSAVTTLQQSVTPIAVSNDTNAYYLSLMIKGVAGSSLAAYECFISWTQTG